MLGDLQHYWSGSFLAANAFIGLNMVGALLLGMLVGYERSYNGRAASTALTVFVGQSVAAGELSACSQAEASA